MTRQDDAENGDRIPYLDAKLRAHIEATNKNLIWATSVSALGGFRRYAGIICDKCNEPMWGIGIYSGYAGSGMIPVVTHCPACDFYRIYNLNGSNWNKVSRTRIPQTAKKRKPKS